MRQKDWITLDYLELFCEKNNLVIGCNRGGETMWISPLGPHPSRLTSGEVHEILQESGLFEVRKILGQDPDLIDSHSITRSELAQQIKKMMN